MAIAPLWIPVNFLTSISVEPIEEIGQLAPGILEEGSELRLVVGSLGGGQSDTQGKDYGNGHHGTRNL